MSFYPISALFGDIDRETAIVFGWEKIIRDVEKEKIKSDLLLNDDDFPL